jgi:flagellar biosynthesis/type III secretory pathway chaperone
VERNLALIYQTLQKLVGLHRQLLDTVRSERSALTNADLKGIQDATYAKEALIEAIRSAETERVKATAQFAVELRRPFNEMTLPNIVIHVQGKDLKQAEQFRTVFNTLTTLIQHIRDQNEDNRLLVERSLEHVNNMKRNVLGESAPQAATYTSQGQRSHNAGNSRLLSQEA